MVQIQGLILLWGWLLNMIYLEESKNQSEHKSTSGIRFSDICEGSQIYTSVWQRTMKIDDNTKLYTRTGEPGIWAWWALVYFSLVTAPRLCFQLCLADQGGCRLYFSLFNNGHEFSVAFRPSHTADEFLFVTVALCSELFFGRLRELPLSSYQHGLMFWATFWPSWDVVELLQ